MGYHTCAEIPVYCGYAQQGTLADNHFAAGNSFSVMAHLYLVSAWSAVCSVHGDPMSCKSSGNFHQFDPDYAWTDITWLLHAHGVSWGYFLYGNGHGSMSPEEDQGDGEAPGPDDLTQVSAWNPLPGFDDVRLDGENQNIQVGANFITAAGSGTLPAVSWVVPPFKASDHPENSIAQGQAWVQKQVNAALNGPDASSTLILLTWDEWGGFYDHVIPPVVDFGGYGFRTPLILIGPMVKPNYIDHQLLTSDAYLKLIEDVFLGSERIDVNDGRPDPRPDVREIAPGLGDLRNDLIGN
jgi:phospholipase C